MTTRYPGGLINKSTANTSLSGASGVWSLPTATQKAKLDQWPVGGVSNPLSYSLRVRSSASAYLSRTFSSSGTNNKIQTLSFWCKIGGMAASTNYTIMSCYDGSSSNNIALLFRDGVLRFDFGGALQNEILTTQVFRDPSAWYHFVLAIDTTQATSSNRVKMYVNGSQITAFSTANYPSQNAASQFTSANANNKIGTWWNNSYDFFDGYLTEVNFIDGQALTPASFGQTNPITGIWESIKYTGTYGTNGFYLPFNTPSNMGKDGSGNNNNWTLSGFNTSTANTTYDVVSDVPTQWTPRATTTDTGGVVRGNYATLSPIDKSSSLSITEGNLKATATSGWNGTRATFSLPATGKWYWEVYCNSRSGGAAVGLLSTSAAITGDLGAAATGYIYNSGDGQKYNNGSNSAYGATWGTGDLIGVAWDSDSGTLTFYKNGSSQGTAWSSLSGTYSPAVGVYNTDSMTANFGQRPFSYSIPSGYKPLCTTNLPDPTIKYSNQYFDVSLWTGDNTSGGRTISGLNFAPDVVWAKVRSQAYSPLIYDTIRGVGGTAELATDQSVVQGGSTSSERGYLSAFNSDGFTSVVGTNGDNLYFNQLSQTYVAWTWKAASSNTTNSSGTITTTVRANPTSGFSIIRYTGNGTNGATIGHGLGVKPGLIIIKAIDGAGYSWKVYNSGLTASYHLELESTSARQSGSGTWNSTEPTSTLITLGTNAGVNENGKNYIAYCWAPINGYSAFGSYIGNGSDDGAFVNLGFKPKFWLIKNAINSYNWIVVDSSRNPSNITTQWNWLYPGLSVAEGQPTKYIDIVSNGVKLRGTGADINESGSAHIYMAFADNPFKYALAR